MRAGIVMAAMIMIVVTPMARAGDGWTLVAQGSKPDREIVVAKDDSIQDRSREREFLANASREDKQAYDAWRRGTRPVWTPDTRFQPYAGPDLEYDITTEAVYENPGKPAQIYTTYQVNCTRNEARVSRSMTFWRQKPYDQAADLPVHTPTDALDRQVVRFTCNRGAQALSAERTAVLTGLGFVSLGDIGSNASDYVWAQVWRDAKQPEYARDVMERNVESTRNSLASAQASVLETARRMQQIDEENTRTLHRTHKNRTLELWINRSDADFAKQYGIPDQVHDGQDGIRTISYHMFTADMTTSMRPVGGTVGSGRVMQEQTDTQTNPCDFDLQVRDGKIIDYAITVDTSCNDVLSP